MSGGAPPSLPPPTSRPVSGRSLPGWLAPLGALGVALAAGAVVIAAVGDDPVAVYGLLFGSALSWPDGIGYTLFYATPLMFTGLAVAVAFHAGLFNIGAEGQLVAGALAAAWAGIVGAGLPAWVLAPLAALAALGAGGAWGALAGWLKARFGAHEVVTTIMLNFIAAALAAWLVADHLKMEGDAILETRPVDPAAGWARLGSLLPRLHRSPGAAGSPLLPERIPLNLAFVAALGACWLVYLLLWRTRWGYELRMTGANGAAAAYGGIDTGRQVVAAMALSGALAGMVGINEVLGYRHRYYDGFSPGLGFTGIAVALLGRNHPAGIVLAALLFGALTRGGLFVGIFSDHVSRDVVVVLEGVAILCLAGGRLVRRRRVDRVRRGDGADDGQADAFAAGSGGPP
jgi:general nucleoside transport system permease protein